MGFLDSNWKYLCSIVFRAHRETGNTMASLRNLYSALLHVGAPLRVLSYTLLDDLRFKIEAACGEEAFMKADCVRIRLFIYLFFVTVNALSVSLDFDRCHDYFCHFDYCTVSRWLTITWKECRYRYRFISAWFKIRPSHDCSTSLPLQTACKIRQKACFRQTSATVLFFLVRTQLQTIYSACISKLNLFCTELLFSYATWFIFYRAGHHRDEHWFSAAASPKHWRFDDEKSTSRQI